MAFLLSTLAGLSTLLGTILIFVKVKNKDNLINFALSFAAGVMITVSLTDLIPESYLLLNSKSLKSIILIILNVNIGLLISVIIDKIVPYQNKLYRVGIISMLAIILHNIPEGIITFMATTQNKKLGIYLAVAIALHNIPEGISISLPIFYSTKSKLKSIIYTFISGISELLGAILTSIFLKDFINNKTMSIVLSIIAGIMIHISIYELLPTSLSYKKYKITLFSGILGSLCMLLSHFLIN